jgi:hypothetical protein
MQRSTTRIRPFVAVTLLAAFCVSTRQALAQDNILIYGNSIINGPTVGFFEDLVAQTGAPTPNVVSWIGNDKNTGDYVAQLGLVTSSLPAGQTWHAMIVEGATLETTTINMPPLVGNPAAFQANMLTIASAYFAHSPNGLFVGHETGADHPNSSRYPAWFANAATWLAFPQAAYEQAAEAITAAHPSSPAVRIAHQGTCWANTIGYGLPFYQNDLHHLSNMGKALVACLYYIEIYGGRIEDIAVDFTVTTPLVSRLLSNGIDASKWRRIVGFADRSQPRGLRPFPGTDSDFQMRIGFASNDVNLVSTKQATSGSQLFVKLISPLDANTFSVAGVYMQILPTGTPPNSGGFPGLQLDRGLMTTWFGVADLTGSAVIQTIPAGLAGNTIWLQAVSRGPSGSAAYPITLSDAQRINIL